MMIACVNSSVRFLKSFWQTADSKLLMLRREHQNWRIYAGRTKRPFNLNNYKLNKVPFNLPYKISNKLRRVYNDLMGNNYVQRNWELQFNGEENRKQLEHFLFENQLDELVPRALTEKYYNAFIHKDALLNAQAINTLLVLSKFNENYRHA